MKTSQRALLKWELCWIPIEIAMVGLGLLLCLRLGQTEAGALVLFSAVAVSGAVRWVHYLRAARQ